MIDLIMDLVYHFFQKITGSGNEGSRQERRDNAMIAAALAVVLLALCTYCLVRGWQTNDSEYLVLGFLSLAGTLLETIRLIQRWRKR